MIVVIAPGAFKGTLSAREATAMLAARHLDDEIRAVPMADGGDDTLDVLVDHGFREHVLQSLGVVGVRDDASSHRTVLVELARLAGMRTLTAPDPWGASTHAVGVALRESLALHPRRILLALGGSASTDGGRGLLRGLAAQPDDGGLAALAALASHVGDPAADDGGVDVAACRALVATTELVVLADVDSPLTGPTGAAWWFGPQKGLDADGCRIADETLAHWAQELGVDPTTPGAGAAGGTAAALLALGAAVRPGGSAVADLVGLRRQVAEADLVITGEGRLDAGTLAGKAPAAVLQVAREAGVPARLVVGSCDPAVAEALRDSGVEVALLHEYRGGA